MYVYSMKTNEQAVEFIKNLENRKRSPVKPGTICLYRSILNTHILPRFGEMDLGLIKNGQMKELVESCVAKGLKPASVQVVSTVLKALVKSVTDDQGNVVYDVKWNGQFVDSPEIDARKQKTPIVSADGLKQAIGNATGQFKGLYALLGGSGLRISEAFGLKVGEDDKKSSYWNPETATIHVRQQMYCGKEQDPKTKAGVRDVDICSRLNSYLIETLAPTGGLLFSNSEGNPFELTGSLYGKIKADGLQGFHSLRRARVTYLRSQQVPENLVKYWIGHGSGNDITSRYDKSATDIKWRKEWSERIGTGFEIVENSLDNTFEKR